jgi:hypothetical protein
LAAPQSGLRQIVGYSHPGSSVQILQGADAFGQDSNVGVGFGQELSLDSDFSQDIPSFGSSRGRVRIVEAAPSIRYVTHRRPSHRRSRIQVVRLNDDQSNENIIRVPVRQHRPQAVQVIRREQPRQQIRVIQRSSEDNSDDGDDDAQYRFAYQGELNNFNNNFLFLMNSMLFDIRSQISISYDSQ